MEQIAGLKNNLHQLLYFEIKTNSVIVFLFPPPDKLKKILWFFKRPSSFSLSTDGKSINK